MKTSHLYQFFSKKSLWLFEEKEEYSAQHWNVIESSNLAKYRFKVIF